MCIFILTMARAPLTEWKAKQILLGGTYRGFHISGAGRDMPKLSSAKRYVVKVDQGIKQRMKRGLLRINCTPVEVTRAISAWKKKGFTSFLVEEMVHHVPGTEERYIAIERVRGGVELSYVSHGGVDVEEHKKEIVKCIIVTESDIISIARKLKIPDTLVRTLYSLFSNPGIASIEINPCIIDDEAWIPLDAAMLIDTTVSDSKLWNIQDVVEPKVAHEEELRVREVQRTTAASLKLRVLNRDGSLFFLLSGGGGSLVVMDAVASAGCVKEIANYGEYSGNPTQQETFLYAREVLRLLVKSKAKRKVLVIAGGIANFTDIRQTFTGLIQALLEVMPQLSKQKVHVVVRRGGPHETEGLRMMKTFLNEHGIHASVYGSETSLTHAASEACTYIRKTI